MMEEQRVVFWELLRQEKEVSTLQNYLMSHVLVLKTYFKVNCSKKP